MAIKICLCGCGSVTPSRRAKYVPGHYIQSIETRLKKSISLNRGAKTPDKDGYLVVRVCGISIREHILVAETAIGRKLGRGHVVHHINGDVTDNRKSNLIVCENDAYHHLLHRRERAFRATGNPNWFKCPFCKQWGPPEEMRITKRGASGHHALCKNEYERGWRLRKRLERVAA